MYKTLGVITVSGLLLTGCATTNENQRATTGAVIGAVTGAVVGHQVDRKRGAAVGAVVGGVAGGVIGHNMDEQERAYRQALEEERRQNEIEVERVRDDMLKLTLKNEVSFPFDSAEIRPGFKPSLDKVADVMARYPDSRITVVGHTDSVGSDAYNQKLSERRAEAVAAYLGTQGISLYRIETVGRGESEPRATNDTAAGREMNRRVEIFVQPTQAAR